jgi:hypothetical protein
MSKISKKEFADLCGMNTRKLAIYIGRGKVIADNNGYIDDKNEVNALFRAKHNGIPKDKFIPPQEQQQIITQQTDIDQGAPIISPARMSLLGIEREKKLADLEKINTDIRINRLKEEKLKGSNIPIDLVKTIIAAMSKSFIYDFKNSAEDIIRILIKSKQYSNAEAAEIRGNLSIIINNAMEKAINNTKKQVKTVIINQGKEQDSDEK